MIYVDNSATTFPKPKIVTDAVYKFITEVGINDSRSTISQKVDFHVDSIRAKIAQFFKMQKSNLVVFTHNATDSLNTFIAGVIQKKDHVITTCAEHNSVLRPLYQLQKEKNLSLSILPVMTTENLDILKKALSSKTRLVVLNHVSNITGFVQPIQEMIEIIRNYNPNILILLDVSQSAGVLSTTFEEFDVDAMACAGHKGLFGIMGIGLLLLKKEIPIHPFRVGGTGIDSINKNQPEVFPTHLEAGTLNMPGIISLGSGITFLHETGIENIQKKEDALKKYFLEKIVSLTSFTVYTSFQDKCCAIVSITHTELSSMEISSILAEENIVTRSGIQCAPLMHKTLHTQSTGTTRFSFGYFNTFEEIDTIISVLSEIN